MNSDRRVLLSGTAANVVGLAAGVLAAFGVQLVLAHGLARGGLGLVTVAVQAAFVAAAGSRAGMDMAALRLTAIALGAAEAARVRTLADRCAAVAFAVSVVVAALLAAGAPLTGGHAATIAVGALSLPFAAAANVYLGATRGLKQMRPTLAVYWIGQPAAWIALTAAALALGGGAEAAVAAYDVSWALALVAARVLWRQATRGLGDEPLAPGELRAALRYGAPRAPSALLAQALFWTDLFVLAHYEHGAQLDRYAAAGRVSQVLLLFLTSVSLIFAPFAADLHARGRRDELDALFKLATRVALAATLPVLIVLFVAAPDVLAAFGPRYPAGADALRILLAGQLLNVATGSVGFVLVMAGRTGLDLVDNAVAVVVLAALAAPLSARHGIEGTAVAAAVTLAGVNALRLVQVARIMHIQPYTAGYVRLALPAAAAAGAALLAHAATEGASWWAALGVTALAGGAVYALLAPWALSREERAAALVLTRRMTNRPAGSA